MLSILDGLKCMYGNIQLSKLTAANAASAGYVNIIKFLSGGDG